MRPELEVADIFRRHGPAYRQAHADHLGGTERRVMAAIEACRTPALGGHAEQCADCGFVRYAFNSCRDRHCPKCQGLARAEWLEARQTELLPVPYFHVVFTVPAQVAEIAFHNKETVYGILFRASAEALRNVAADPRYLGAETGAISVLPPGDRPSICTRTFIASFREVESHRTRHAGSPVCPASSCRWACSPAASATCSCTSCAPPSPPANSASPPPLPPWPTPPPSPPASMPLAAIEWVVYAKPPFAGPEQVLGYLGRYTHRVAIANSRLVGLKDGQVSFTWKDYRQDSKIKVMTLEADEFIRRFLQHTVPDEFHRIRHVGFLANCHRAAKLALCRDLLAVPPPVPDDPSPQRWQDRLRDLTGEDIELCPCCGGRMVTCGTLPPQPPPRPPMWCDSS